MLMRTTIASRLNLVFVLVATGVVHTFPAAATDHPSLCVRRAELAALRDKTLVPGIPAEIWAEVRAAAEQAVNQPVVTLDRKTDGELGASWNARVAARNMELLSLAYLVTEDERFAERAKQTALAAAPAPTWIDQERVKELRAAVKERYAGKKPPPFHYTDVMAGDLSRGVGFVYDWLYDYLGPADRDRLRSATVEKGIRPVLDDLANGIWWAEQWHTHGAESVAGIGIAALSFIDEEAEAPPWVSEAKRWTAGGGWTEKDVLVAMRSGEITGLRPEFDLNNVIVTAYGRPVLVNRFATDTARLDTGAYNCVLIDGKGQSTPAAGRILEFRDERGYNYVCTDATAAYGAGAARVHRHMVFVKPAYLVVIDDVATGEPGPFEQRWHTVDRIETSDSFATLHSGEVTLRVEPFALDGQPTDFEVRTDILSEPAADGPDITGPLPYLSVRSTRPVARYTSVTVLTPGLKRSRSYHPRVEGDPDRFTVKLKRNQWRDTIECERMEDGQLSVTVKFEPALRLPPVRGQRPRDRDGGIRPNIPRPQ